MTEQGLGSLGCPIRIGADDLRQAAELLERVTLGDPLRTEHDVDPAASLGEVLGDVFGRARVDGAAQDDEGPVPEMRRDLVDGALEDGHRRAEELVDRRADDDDHGLGPIQDRRIVGQLEPTGRQELGEERVGTRLEERHPAGLDHLDGPGVRVEDPDPKARLGEHEAQRQTDVTAAAEHHDIKIVQGFGALLWQTKGSRSGGGEGSTQSPGATIANGSSGRAMMTTAP